MHPRVVATGCGLIAPGGSTVEALWRSLLSGRSCHSPLEGEEWKDHPVKIAGRIPGDEPALAALPERVRRHARCVQLAVSTARAAAAQAALPPDRSRTAVILGTARGPLIESPRPGPRAVERSMLVALSAGVAQDLQTGGVNFTISATCASSLHALGTALLHLRAGTADFVLAGGAEASLTPEYLLNVWAAGVAARPGDALCRPFDRRRCGTVFGEGAALFVLEREETARRRGALPLFEIAGYGGASDAENLHEGSPDGAGIASAVERALADAGLRPEEIGYVNAHATGTARGDRIEAAGLRRALGGRKIPVSSTKGVTGHPIGASGAIGTAAAAMALRTGLLPPTANLEEPDPECDLEHVMGSPRESKAGAAIVVSTGFGGTNGALVLKAYRVTAT